MNDVDRLIKRLAKKRKEMEPNSLEMRTALTRIGTFMQAAIRQNIGRYKIIDSSRLLTSIKYELEQSGDKAILSVGSYGVKYAAMNEFGGPMEPKQVIAMIIELRKKKKSQSKGKGIVTVNKDLTGYWQPRPFMRGAFKQHKGFIIDMLRSVGRDK